MNTRQTLFIKHADLFTLDFSLLNLTTGPSHIPTRCYVSFIKPQICFDV
uniref:Uncharacterized protein n=1 Tax=Anguilla anguilla TaxID=7936 RepID=A0A0E9UTZ9_ANGAN